MARRFALTAEILEGGSVRRFTVRGQTAKALAALVEAGPRGRTALEVATWAYRFSAYTFELIHDHGLVIRTDREKHPGGWHGRHVLVTPVRIVAMEGADGAGC